MAQAFWHWFSWTFDSLWLSHRLLVRDQEQRRLRNLENFAPSSIPGIFMGYHFQPGMKWKKDVLVLSLSDLNNNDFREYLKPIRTHQIKVPDGDYTFPVLQRYLHVQAGLATDALERPITQARRPRCCTCRRSRRRGGASPRRRKNPRKLLTQRQVGWLKSLRAVATMIPGARWEEGELGRRNPLASRPIYGLVCKRPKQQEG